MSAAPGYLTPDISDPETWRPNIPPEVQKLETMSFVGNDFAGIFYGMTVILFIQCMGALWHSQSAIRRPLLLYVTTTFVLSTLFTAFNMNIVIRGFIQYRNFPGTPTSFPPGPQGYVFYSYSNWRVIIPNACFIVSNWMADGLLMFRCYVLYNRHPWVLILPAFMYCASFAMGVITLFKTSQPESSLFSHVSFDFALPYFTISVSLNILLTLMMSVRLIQHLSSMRKDGPAPSGLSRYGKVVTILIESCALYAITSILFIGTYGAGHNASVIFLPILSQTQVIAPYLIILRVALNRSVKYKTTTAQDSVIQTRTGLVFNRPVGSTVDSMDATGNLQLNSIMASRSQGSSRTMDTPVTKEGIRHASWGEPQVQSRGIINNV